MKKTIIAAAMLALGASGATAQNLTIATSLSLNTMDPHFFNGFPAGSAHPQIWDALTEIDEKIMRWLKQNSALAICA